MNTEERKVNLQKIAGLKKQLLINRIKISSGETALAKDTKKIKKDIARTFTVLNKKEKKK